MKNSVKGLNSAIDLRWQKKEPKEMASRQIKRNYLL